MFNLTRFYRLVVLMIFLALGANDARAQTSAFTYQGKLADSGNPASGQYDLQFKLFDTVTLGTGTQQGGTITVTSVTVAAGIFTVQLDFGSCPTCFDGSARFLEIAVKQTSGSTFTTLGPRQPVTSTPYAIKSQNAATADGLSIACVNCVTTSQIQSIQGSQVAGAIPVASVPAGSGNYIQNGTVAQGASNFNISGNGTAGETLSGNVVNSATQFDIGGNRVLSNPGNSNLFAGVGAGYSNTTGSYNSFFGDSAGSLNTIGSDNSFFGRRAGAYNQTGGANSFFGNLAGYLNTNGFNNSFFGDSAGILNTAGQDNSFFGTSAGASNTASRNSLFGSYAGANNSTGQNNSFFGTSAGYSNTIACCNSFFGDSAGFLNTSGQFNSFFGNAAGNANTTGNDNSLFGAGAGDLNGTGSENSFFGSAAGFDNTNGSRNSFFGRQAGAGNTTASSNSFFGAFAGNVNTTGGFNSFFGSLAGQNNTTGGNNVFVGDSAGIGNLTGSSNTLIGANAGVGSSNLSFATALGFRALVAQSNSLVLGSINGVNSATADTNVGIGTTAPNARFHIAVNSGNTLFGDAGCPAGYTAIGFGSSLSGCTNYSLSGNGANTIINRPAGGQITFREDNAVQMTILSGGAVRFNGMVAIDSLNTTGGTTTLCRTTAAPYAISACTSSLRYKTNIAPFSLGLNLINKLQPITFDWKAGGMHDVGFSAEDVARVNPLLVTYNAKGEVEGVKYDRLSVAFVNAFKEQQAQIQRQQDQIKSQQNQIDALRQLICLDRPNADACK